MLMWLWDVSIEVSSESLPRRPFDTLLEMLKNHCIVKHFPCRLLMSRSIFRNAFRSTRVNLNVWKMPRSDPDDSRCQINRSLIGLRASVLRLIGRDFDSFAWRRGIWISSRQKTGHSCSFQIDVRHYERVKAVFAFASDVFCASIVRGRLSGAFFCGLIWGDQIWPSSILHINRMKVDLPVDLVLVLLNEIRWYKSTIYMRIALYEEDGNT